MGLQDTRFEVRRYDPLAKFHTHDHHQIVLPIRGTLEMVVDDREGEVSDLRAAAIPAGQKHGFAGSADNAFLIVNLPSPMRTDEAEGALWSAAGDVPFVAFEESLRGFCETVMRDRRILNGPGVRADVAGTILVEALERAAGLSPKEAGGPLAKAVALIETHFADPLTVKGIAREVGISESRLYALFEDRFQAPPQRFVVQRRMERAALYLTESRLSIAEIAHRVGYGDQSAFSRAFRRVWGETPAAYRRARKTVDTV